ncbi:MAG: type II secretion system protein GspM [Xanthobacteraceae bacterium]
MNTVVIKYLARYPIAAAVLYAGLVVVLLSTVWTTISDILERRQAVAASTELLNQLEGRRPTAMRPSARPDIPGGNGSPFLEGPTVTVAGAALLQRVASEVTSAGGNVLSSQVDLEGTQAKAGFVGVVASCELDQPSLQKVLYDLEAGFPFLFVDQLVVQAPAGTSTQPGAKLRLSLGVSGQWQAAK